MSTSVADFLAGSDDPDIVDETAQVGEEPSPLGTPTDRTVPVGPEPDRPVCQEPGCEKACRKRRNSDEFFPFCATHNALHNASTVGSPKSQSYEALTEQRKKAAFDIENAVIGWFQPVQIGLMASGDAYCATAIGHEVPPIAKALGDLSNDFPWLQRTVGVVDKWTELSQLAFHLAKLMAMVAVHHEWVPYEGAIRFLVPPPTQFRMTDQPEQPVSPNGHSFT